MGKLIQHHKTAIARSLLISFLLMIFLHSNSQHKEANIWYLGFRGGLDFNSGEPVVIPYAYASPHGGFQGNAVQCDTSGNLLFYSEGVHIYNRERSIMLNGEDLAGGDPISAQRVIIVQQPGHEQIYYVFIVGRGPGSTSSYSGLWYNIVDMEKDGTLGEVVQRDVFVTTAYDAKNMLFSLKHKNKHDIFIITHKGSEKKYATYILGDNGFNPTPVLSESQNSNIQNSNSAQYIKVSYNKKYLFFSDNDDFPGFIEICKFNEGTGSIEYLYTEYRTNAQGENMHPSGIEFSPDSKYAYIAFNNRNRSVNIYQYDMQYVENAGQFTNSALPISIDGPGLGLQLATDGKIYCSYNPPDAGATTWEYQYVSVIHKPWERGAACNFEADAIDLTDPCYGPSLVNIHLDYLYRFEWEGTCSGPDNGIAFKPNFQPTPESITWNFNDPDAGADSISTELYPVHYFTHGGEFEVSVEVHYPPTSNYPFGRVEETSRIVEVIESPHPNLGLDTLVCEGTEVTLYAGNEDGFYAWSDGTTFGQNIFNLTVADTGIYWVQVTNSNGCSTKDSIHVGWFNKAAFNETNMVITPTSCGGSNGSIAGIQIEGVVAVSTMWYDGDDNLIGNTIDIDNLSVGNYFLHVTDTNNCISVSNSYTITDAGNILITAVDFLSSHCMQSSGSISITASSGAGNDFLYSIDNGNTWQSDSLFTDLPSSDYFIRVKDQSGCETVYGNNPVFIENIEGPLITTVDVTHENDYLTDGSIYIEAIINIGDILYSIDSGYSFQTNNGLFENLSAGIYYCMTQDEFGCDTTFTIEINRVISQIIDAIAGDGSTCIGDATASPLLLNNFTDISSFHVMLTYDEDLIICDGYMQVHPDLEDSLIVSTTSTGEVHISWQGQSPISLPDNSQMTKLVFSAIDNGLSQVDWVANQGESQFFNENGEQINTDYELGYILVYTRPDIYLSPTNEVCEDESLFIVASVEGGSGINTSHWIGPDNFTSDNQLLWFNHVLENMAGTYTLTVTDSLNCVESKSMELIVNPVPTITFSQYDTLWVDPGYVLEAGYGAEFYQWNTGVTTETIVIDSIGSYNVEVTSYENCKSTDTVQILWGGAPFYIPNAFTPNGDGLNDTFEAIPKYDYVNRYHISIYNRWGQMIFETSNINSGWNGTYQGNPCMIGAYVYRIVYEEFGQQPMESKVVEGTVMLVR